MASSNEAKAVELLLKPIESTQICSPLVENMSTFRSKDVKCGADDADMSTVLEMSDSTVVSLEQDHQGTLVKLNAQHSLDKYRK